MQFTPAYVANPLWSPSRSSIDPTPSQRLRQGNSSCGRLGGASRAGPMNGAGKNGGSRTVKVEKPST